MSIPEGYIQVYNPGGQSVNLGQALPASVSGQIVQRMCEMNPSTAVNIAGNLSYLNSRTIGSGETLYLGYDPQTNAFIWRDPSSMPNLVSGVSPDGNRNLAGNFGTTTVGSGRRAKTYSYNYVPSSGFNNLLGYLTVQ